jgi:hypothetical protein
MNDERIDGFNDADEIGMAINDSIKGSTLSGVIPSKA